MKMIEKISNKLERLEREKVMAKTPKSIARYESEITAQKSKISKHYLKLGIKV